MTGRPDWERQGSDWPNRAASRFVQAGGLRWHVQVMGSGPVALLVHGTGAATHSWRDLAPLLARHFTVVAPDIPGHGFTESPPAFRLSLPGMADEISSLLAGMGVKPDLAIGHSAGAAILARMCLDGSIAPRGLICLNGALLALRGVAGRIFAPVAKMLSAMPFVPGLLAWRATDGTAIARLMADTGSRIDAAGIEFYRRLISNPAHVSATLGMMANWDLDAFAHDLPKLAVPLALIVGDRDRAVPPADAVRVQALLPNATIDTQPGLGHLAHEEDPAGTAAPIFRIAERWKVGGRTQQ
jgi:magnesium chelatase accessory protein